MPDRFASHAHRRLHLMTRVSRLRRRLDAGSRSAALSARADRALEARRRELEHLEALARDDETGEEEGGRG